MDAACNAMEAVRRAQVRCQVGGGKYILGTGDYHPTFQQGSLVDVPWTTNQYGTGSDCAGFAICWAWKLARHRPGFNHGLWASIEDDINVNSAMEDAEHHQELFTRPDDVRPGDLLCYPTIRLSAADGVHQFIGHVALVETVPDDFAVGQRWSRLTVLQCHGPTGFTPGVVRTDGSIWDHHDAMWPKPHHRTMVVRPKERK